MNIGVILYHFNNKEGFHSDEQWSYAHANSTQGAYLDKEIDSFHQIDDNIKARLFYRWIDGNRFHNYLTVQEQETFAYKNIFNNLQADVHPPLYFMLLHTVSSFFLNSFSKWHAGSINLVLFVLIYIVLYKLSLCVLKDEWLALCCVALWGFSEIGIDSVVFLRMYILQTLLSLGLIYETVKMLQDNAAKPQRLLLIFLYSFLGVLTQYNSIFFSFFVAMVAAIILLKRKNYKLMFQFGGVMALSVFMLFLVFPPAYRVLLESMRAKQVISSINAYTGGNGEDIFNLLYKVDRRLTYVMELLSEHFFAFAGTNHKFIVLLIIMGITASVYLKIKISSDIKFILYSVLLYFIYLLSMPYMYIFHGRYYMNIIPFFAIFSILIVRNILKFILPAKILPWVVAVLVLVNSLALDFSQKSPYAFRWHKSEYEAYNRIKNREVFIDNGDMVIFLHSMAYFLAAADKVFITDNICDEPTLAQIAQTKSSVVLTYASYIFSDSGITEINCLQKMGWHYKYKICPSQHCYNVWEKTQ